MLSIAYKVCNSIELWKASLCGGSIYKYSPCDGCCTKCQCLRSQLSHVWVGRSFSAVITLSLVTEAYRQQISTTGAVHTWLNSSHLSVEPRCLSLGIGNWLTNTKYDSVRGLLMLASCMLLAKSSEQSICLTFSLV